MGMKADEFISTKTRADTEWRRRKYVGSMVNYAGLSYTPQVPASGTLIYATQANLVLNPLLYVKPYGNLSIAAIGNLIPSNFDYTAINNWLAALEAEPYTGASSCQTSCSGLCRGQCSGTCSGCSG